jgi:hypothetical protein
MILYKCYIPSSTAYSTPVLYKKPVQKIEQYLGYLEDTKYFEREDTIKWSIMLWGYYVTHLYHTLFLKNSFEYEKSVKTTDDSIHIIFC